MIINDWQFFNPVFSEDRLRLLQEVPTWVVISFFLVIRSRIGLLKSVSKSDIAVSKNAHQAISTVDNRNAAGMR